MQFLENSISRVSLNLWLHIQSQFTSLRRVMLKDIPLQLVTFQNDKSRREWIYSPPCSIGRTYWKSRFRDNLYTVAFYQKMLDTHGKLRCIHLYYGISNKPKFWKNCILHDIFRNHQIQQISRKSLYWWCNLRWITRKFAQFLLPDSVVLINLSYPSQLSI